MIITTTKNRVIKINFAIHLKQVVFYVPRSVTRQANILPLTCIAIEIRFSHAGRYIGNDQAQTDFHVYMYICDVRGEQVTILTCHRNPRRLHDSQRSCKLNRKMNEITN